MRTVDSAFRGRRSLAVAVPIAMIATALALPVVANAASTVPTGGYSGTSDAYNGATVEFSIDGDGRMTNFATESYLYCGSFPTAIQWAEQPPLQVTAGSTFTQEWTFSDVEYELSGVITADGDAVGIGVAKMPSIGCTGLDFEWTATADEDPIVVDPEVTLSPSEVTVSELASSGITVWGTGFVPDASVSLTVGGASGGNQTADADGDVTFTFSGDLAAGSHAVVLSSTEGDASSTLTVVEDPVVVDPEVSVSPSEVTVSEFTSSGVAVSGTGFAPNSSVSLSVGGVHGGTKNADADGAVSFAYVSGSQGVGSYNVVLSSADGSASSTLTVVDDPVVVDPAVSVSPSEVTVSELASSGVAVSGTGFAPGASVSLTVGGVDGGSQSADADGNVEFSFSGELAAGPHAVVLSSADGDAEASLTVVDDPLVVDPAVSVSPAEVTVSELASSGVAVSGTGFAPGASVSLTVGGVDGGSQSADADGNVEFSFSGELAAGPHAVVLSSADGDAEASLTVVDDPVVVDPAVSGSPAEVTVSELASSGVAVSGTGFAPDALVSLTVGGVDGGSQSTAADGNVEFSFSGELAAGPHAVVLSSTDGDAETSLTVVEDPVVIDPELPEQIPAETPSEDELTADNGGAVSVPEGTVEGEQVTVRIGDAQPGDVIGVWLFSTPQYLGTFTVSDDLTVTVELPEGITGAHRIAVYDIDGQLQGWDTTIIAPAQTDVPTPGDQAPDAEDGDNQLAATGGDSSGALGAGLVLLLAGALTLVVWRLRASARA
ncbi:hypothetical protein [Microbacterium sp.]|uniref:hypothetical protein n=1 Tax=Microbacterium sp. TaxID=51671 RepID=UPI0026103F06|nr:hypothetical protein [Microbacterium sp.]